MSVGMADDNRLQLVANEISLGFTFIESSLLSYSMGHEEHGEQGRASARAAYQGAERFLEGQTGSQAETLRDDLELLRMALDSLEANLH